MRLTLSYSEKKNDIEIKIEMSGQTREKRYGR